MNAPHRRWHSYSSIDQIDVNHFASHPKRNWAQWRSTRSWNAWWLDFSATLRRHCIGTSKSAIKKWIDWTTSYVRRWHSIRWRRHNTCWPNNRWMLYFVFVSMPIDIWCGTSGARISRSFQRCTISWDNVIACLSSRKIEVMMTTSRSTPGITQSFSVSVSTESMSYFRYIIYSGLRI